MIRTLASFIILVGIFFSAQANSKTSVPVNLSTITFNDGRIVQLDHAWEFYWKKFYSPLDFEKGRTSAPDALVNPTSWNDVKIKNQKCGSYGFATYRLVLLHVPHKKLVLDAWSVQTACKIFVNGQLVAVVGKVGTSAYTSVPANRDVQIPLPNSVDQIEIVVQISNFHHRKGGFVHPFEIGEHQTILKQRQLYYILDAAETSALAIIGLFLLALYVFRRKDKSVLYFSLFCITLSLRPVISVNYLLATFIPSLPWSIMIKLEYIGVLFPCLFMVLFIRSLFPKHFPSFLVKFFILIFGLKILITLLFPVYIFSWLVLPLLVIIPVGILVMTYVMVRATLARAEGANYGVFGLVILFISLLLKVTSYAGIIPPVHVLITLLDIGFIFMMSLILGSRFSMQFVKVETLQRQTETQKSEIEVQKKALEQQKDLLQEKNKEILDSINYARRLQSAILPPEKLLKSYFSESFILYQPKDIVAGDFYWIQEIEKNGIKHVLVAVCDCTGHGVPGAMVSVVCSNALDRAVKEFAITDPGKILDKVRELVIETFVKSDEEVKDGMDISLCSMSFQVSGSKSQHEVKPETAVAVLQWAGANNPLWIVTKGALKEIKPDKQPIGVYSNITPFTTQTIAVDKGDWLYLFSDGYADQFGGDKGKKFKYSNLQKTLLNHHHEKPEIQKSKLETGFYAWKGDLEQLDDVSIIGIRIG